MSEQRVATLVVEVAGRKTNIEQVLQGVQRELRGAQSSAATAANQIGGGLAAGSSKAAREMLQLAQAAQKVVAEEQKTAQAAARAAQEQTKVAAQQARAAAEGSKLAVAQSRVAAEEQKAAVQAQRLATETARTAAAQNRAQIEALRLAQAQERVASGNRGWVGQVTQAAGSVDRFVGTLQGLGGAFAVVSAAQGLYSAAQQGAALDAARKSFDNLAASANTSGAALLRSLQQASAGTVANADIIKSSNTALLLLGSDVASKLPQLLAVAKASATTLGTDVGQVFDSLVTGISRGSTELIDNAGITVKASEAYATYAASIGKSADQLSASEKQQAILNAVLVSGQQIISQTAGGAESANVSFQRFEASLSNLQAAASGLAANGLAPVVSWLGQVTQAAADGIGELSLVDQKNQQLATNLVAGAANYEQYAQRVAQAQQLAKQAFDEAYAGDPIEKLIAQAIGAQPVIEQLSQGAFAYSQALQAQGVSVADATLKAQAYDLALQSIAETQNVASLTLGQANQDYTLVAQAAQEALVANAGLAPEIQQVVDAFNAHNIGAAEAIAQLGGLIAAQADHAAGSGEAAQADQDAAAAALATAAAAREAEASANADAFAKLQQSAAAQETAQRHDELERAILAAAASSGSATAAAAAIAARFNGTEAPAIANLINLYRQLNAARGSAAAIKGATNQYEAAYSPGATARAQQLNYERKLQDDITRATGSTAERLALVNRELARAPRYSDEARRLAVEQARLTKQQQDEAARGAKGGSTGGGGAKKTQAAKDAEQDLKDRQRQYDKLRDVEDRYHEQSAKAEETYQQRVTAIQAKHAEEQLKAQQELARESTGSRADFYEGLLDSDLPQQAAQNLSAAYEQAFAEAQQMAQAGNADLADDYLALKEKQLDAERQYQEKLAALQEQARKGGSAGKEAQNEIAKLNAIKDLRDKQFATEEAQLRETGGGSKADRDAALADAAADREQALTDARLDAGKALEDLERKRSDAAKITTEQLQQQLSLVEQITRAGGLPGAATSPSTTPTAPAPPPASGAPAANAALPGSSNGATPVIDAAAVAALAQLAQTLERGMGELRRAIDGINARTPLQTS